MSIYGIPQRPKEEPHPQQLRDRAKGLVGWIIAMGVLVVIALVGTVAEIAQSSEMSAGYIVGLMMSRVIILGVPLVIALVLLRRRKKYLKLAVELQNKPRTAQGD